MFEVVGEAQSLDVFLQSRRNIPLVSSERIAGQLWADACKQGLDFFQFGFGTRSSATPECAIIGFSGILCHGAMKEKYDLLREIRYVTAGLRGMKGRKD